MQKNSWLVNKDRLWAMRFFKDKYPNEDGTFCMRVHYANCKQKFLDGITPNVQLHGSKRLTYEKVRDLWISSLETGWIVSKNSLWMTS